MKKLLELFGKGGRPKGTGPKKIDPGTIIFSISTIADDRPALKEAGPVGTNELIFHEDDWRQLEFFDRARLEELTPKLKEAKDFSNSHRQGVGWNKVYVRQLAVAPVIGGANAVNVLGKHLGVAAAPGPILSTASAIIGRVADGFSFQMGGGVWLYGVSDDAGVPVLGACVLGGDDEVLVRTFAMLNANHGVFLVDWRAHMVLTGVEAGGQIKTWRA